jgi:hypothetical protein
MRVIVELTRRSFGETGGKLQQLWHIFVRTNKGSSEKGREVERGRQREGETEKKKKVSCRRDLKAKTLYKMTLLSAHLFVPPLSKFLLLSHYMLSTFAPE